MPLRSQAKEEEAVQTKFDTKKHSGPSHKSLRGVKGCITRQNQPLRTGALGELT